jgi:hypothetical protein
MAMQDHPEEHISTLATELHVRIITRDRSWFSDSTTETGTARTHTVASSSAV